VDDNQKKARQLELPTQDNLLFQPFLKYLLLRAHLQDDKVETKHDLQ
jgi:hypothetical protein